MARIPTPVRGVNLLSLPLSTTEGFVLSRVDGSTSVEDISIMSGIDQNKVLTILDRLAELGAVELSWLGPRVKPPAAAADADAARSQPAKPADNHFAAARPRYPRAEIEADADIPKEKRKRILDAYYAMEGRNHYQLLGVSRRADKKTIRAAYFELSKLFHPDAYFGKQLGGFKLKMEEVFKRLTEAYETLGKSKKRAEYDEYLASTEQTQRARQTLDSLEFSAEEIQALREAAERVRAEAAAREAARAESEALRPPRVPAADSQPVRSAAPSPATSQRPAPTNAERRARVRDRLRQRLGSISSQRPAGPASQPPPPSAESRRSLIDGLKQSIRASAALSASPRAQVDSHVKKAAEAERAGDVLLAASQLQAALVIDPKNQELLAEYDRVSKVVARNLAVNYEKQAQYEEKTGNWQAAARSWARVSDGRPEDAHAAYKAAEAMLKASDDLHRAQKYAQKAVNLDGRNLTHLTVLARVYLAAGLKLNAVRELEKAAQLAPGDELVNNLLREAR